jgi:hypothetical protein
MSARKDDNGKPQYALLPIELLESVATVLTWATVRENAPHDPRNWERGMEWSRPFSALMRHMWRWFYAKMRNQTGRDSESGLSELAHAACCIAMLVTYEARGVGRDDRPPQVPPGQLLGG